MKSKIWLYQFPIILLCTFAYYVVFLGENGELNDPFLRSKIFPTLRSWSGNITNWKFKLRGEEPPRNKIVIVAIDDRSIDALGRWPWHREVTGYLVDKIFEAGAKVVGLDIVFSEPDQRVPDELAAILAEKNLPEVARQFETDPFLQDAIRRHKDRLVLGWMSPATCQPAYMGKEDGCDVLDPEINFPKGFERFGIGHVERHPKFDITKTSVISTINFLPNIPLFQDVAEHAGSLDVEIGPDGYIRHAAVLRFGKDIPLTGLALEMAKVGLGEDLSIGLNEDSNIQWVKFAKSGREIALTPQGVVNINFRGPGYTFPYVSVLDVLGEDPSVTKTINRTIASTTDPQFQVTDRSTFAQIPVLKSDLLKDAYVLVGATALGIYDLRTFPFDSNVPGVEGHATILDNLLAGDFFIPSSKSNSLLWMLSLMLIGATAFAFFTERFEALPALGLFVIVVVGFGMFDVTYLFANRMNWDTCFFYLEILLVFVFTLAAKYVLEEQQKKFIHSAFGRYVSPKMVDTIVEDPSKLSLGGEKKELTILFSDIRGFTTLSEKMDAKQLAQFLNQYLGVMTDIIVNEYNGTLDKYIGDAIMAFWGAPISQNNHANNACLASIKMQKRLKELRDQYKKEYDIEIEAGVGLNSGMVSVGNMGSEKNFNYTVIGDHVNLASRLEGLTKYYGVAILTSRDTLDCVKNSKDTLPPHRVLDLVKVKGKKQAVELIEILDRECSIEGMKAFDEARNFYSQQQWDRAIEHFKKAAELLKKSSGEADGPCQMFLERCDFMKNNPPGKDWDGSWEMTSK